jgi:hypothetical protein
MKLEKTWERLTKMILVDHNEQHQRTLDNFIHSIHEYYLLMFAMLSTSYTRLTIFLEQFFL